MNAKRIITAITITLVASTIIAVTALTITFNSDKNKIETQIEPTYPATASYTPAKHAAVADTIVTPSLGKKTLEADTCALKTYTTYIGNHKIAPMPPLKVRMPKAPKITIPRTYIRPIKIKPAYPRSPRLAKVLLRIR